MIRLLRRFLAKPTHLDELEASVGRQFRNRDLLIEAITHSSYAREHKNVVDNERLEFLGDAVLQLIATEHVYADLTATEGQMTKHRASLVCGESLHRIAQDLKLGEHILLGKGEKKSGGSQKKKILENCTESIVGAIYQDGGMKAVRKFLTRYWDVHKQPASTDHKTEAQEVFQRARGATPRYRVVDASGPAHARRFTVEMLVAGEVLSRGDGGSIKAAEQAAAKIALHAQAQIPAQETAGATAQHRQQRSGSGRPSSRRRVQQHVQQGSDATAPGGGDSSGAAVEAVDSQPHDGAAGSGSD